MSESKKQFSGTKDRYVLEPGERALATLIKEAGATARTRKKKAMAEHLRRLRAAICNTSISDYQVQHP